MANLITETLVLPSAATKLYGDTFDGQLTLRAMTTEEERIRLSSQSFYSTMVTIVNECIVDNKNSDGTYKIDSALFTDFDFFATLVKLRIMSYGPMYKTVAVCSKCGHQFAYKANLAEDLLYNLIPDDFTEPYDVGPLPGSGDTLGCRFLRIKDRIDIEKQANLIKTKNPNYIGDPTFQLEMQRRIMTVNGKELDYVTAEEYVKNMIAMDSVVYHDNVNNGQYGVVPYVIIDRCDNPMGCDGKSIWVIKTGKEFFRPCLDD